MTALAAVTAVAVAVVAMALLGHGRTGTTAAPRSGSSGAKGLQGLPTITLSARSVVTCAVGEAANDSAVINSVNGLVLVRNLRSPLAFATGLDEPGRDHHRGVVFIDRNQLC